MKRQRAWVIFGVGIILIYAVINFFLPYPDPNKTLTMLTMPDEYYQLPVKSGGVLICFDEQATSSYIGTVKTHEHSGTDQNSHHILETSNILPSEYSRGNFDALGALIDTLSETLLPHTLFYIHSKVDHGHIYIYLRRETSSYDFRFWEPRFEKEWELLKDLEYDLENESEAIRFANETLREVFDGPCTISFF